MPSKDFLADAKPVQQQDDFLADAKPLPAGVTKDEQGRYGSEAEPSTLSLYGKALFNPVGSGAHPQGLVGGAEQVGGQAMQNMLSPVMHPIDTAKGIWATAKEVAQDAPQSPFYNPSAEAENPGPLMQQGRELKDEWKNNKPLALENAAGNVLGTVEGGRMAAAAVPKAFAAIPTRAKGAELLNEVSQSANGKPVVFSRTMKPLEEAQRLSSYKHGNIAALDDLYKRINTVNPMDYAEARGRYTPITQLTSEDLGRTTKQLQAQAGKVAHAMREDIGDTARAAGKGPEYEKGMKTYRRASQISSGAKHLGKTALRVAPYGAAGASGYGLYKAFK